LETLGFQAAQPPFDEQAHEAAHEHDRPQELQNAIAWRLTMFGMDQGEKAAAARLSNRICR